MRPEQLLDGAVRYSLVSEPSVGVRVPAVLHVFATEDDVRQPANQHDAVHVLGGLINLRSANGADHLNLDLPKAKAYNLYGVLPRRPAATTVEATATVMYLAETVLRDRTIVGYDRDVTWP